jgi:hypothetical protein
MTRPPPHPPKSTRRHPRYTLFASVELKKANETLVLAARNISLGGVLLEADDHEIERFPLGGVVDIHLCDAFDPESPAWHAQAQVIRHEHDAMALMWVGDDPDTLHQLDGILRRMKQKE